MFPQTTSINLIFTLNFYVLLILGDVLEIGALWSILKKDIPSFERYMAQLKCYYFDYK